MSQIEIGRLMCPTCGGESFEANQDRSYVKCETCGRVFSGGLEELKELNMPEIEKAARSVAEDKLTKMFKKSFSK